MMIIGSVAAGTHDAGRRGNVEATVYDLTTGRTSRHVLHQPITPEERKRWLDDHNAPAFAVRPDGRVLAMYTLHGADEKILYRISTRPHEASAWGEERTFAPSPSSRVTYTNLHFLAAENSGKGRLYNFFRGLDNSFKPSFAFSDNHGETWTTGNVFIDVPTRFRHRPYVKYASDGRESVHMAYTEGHPRDFDNSIYHVVYRRGSLRKSSGEIIRDLSEGLKAPEEGTLVFQGDPNNVAWISDLHIDANGHPYLVFTVQKDSANKPPGQGGEDHRFHYARWDGKRWRTREIAYAGKRLYPGEDDYTGLAALDPHDPRAVFISTDAHPATGEPLISRANGQRHREIFRGTGGDEGVWTWTAVTENSMADNIRPVIPIWPGKRRAVLWLRGAMRTYTDYRFEIVGLIENRSY